MAKNNMKLLEELPNKILEWKKTENLEEMKTYFTKVFVSDLFLECHFDYYIEQMNDLIKENNFNVEYFLKMNKKYPDSMFHEWIVEKQSQ